MHEPEGEIPIVFSHFSNLFSSIARRTGLFKGNLNDYDGRMYTEGGEWISRADTVGGEWIWLADTVGGCGWRIRWADLAIQKSGHRL
jgi:hypothetical protein